TPRSYTSFVSDCGISHCLLQDTPTAVQTRHDGADGNVEDLGGVRVGEVADVYEHDHVAKVVRNVRERLHDVLLRESLDDAVGVALPVTRLLQLVVEEVVAFLER